MAMGQLAIGVALVLAAIVLIFIGMPNRAGQHPRFLQFEASLVLYPPVILVLLAMGTAEIISALLGMSRLANIEQTATKIVLKAGSTALTLDKDVGKATLQQKMLLWSKKPVEFSFSDIDDIAVKSDTGAMSGASQTDGRNHRADHRGGQERRRNGEETA